MPPSPDLLTALRLEVGRFRAEQPLRRFPPVVHLGEPGGPRVSRILGQADPAAYDAGVRADILAVLLEELASPPSAGWLSRPGEPSLHDLDLAWLAAGDQSCGALGWPPPQWYAVTRTGWLDVRSGDRRTWNRLRL